jgi:DNA-binding beta-propeller fold protein YncE
MDTIKLVTNFGSNIILFLAFTAFVIFVFGRTNSKIHNLPWYRVITLKIGLAFVTCAALLNALTLSNPEWSEVILNFGLALVMSWAAVYHFVMFVIPYKTAKLENQVDRPVVTKKVSKKPRKSALNKK